MQVFVLLSSTGPSGFPSKVAKIITKISDNDSILEPAFHFVHVSIATFVFFKVRPKMFFIFQFKVRTCVF